jgi:hypothetical protein
MIFYPRSKLPGSQIELQLVLLQHSTGHAHPLAMEPNILVYRDIVANIHLKYLTVI